MKLGLGTAQFGQDYGISNKDGRPSEAEVSAILTFAAENGAHLLDTAPAYQLSEDIIGRRLPRLSPFKIVTKTPKVKGDRIESSDAAAWRESLLRSLERLNVPRVYALLAHDTEDLLKPGGELLIRELEKLVHDGLVEKIGVSVYTADQIDRALAKFNFQILQAPLNVFDQRLIESGHLSVLKQKNIEVHARSLFLQGLLLMEESEVGEMFPAIISHFHEYRAYLTRQGLTPLEGALAFARQVKEVDTVIVGVCSRDQLESILRAWNKVTARIDFRPFSLRNDKIVDPRFWEAKR